MVDACARGEITQPSSAGVEQGSNNQHTGQTNHGENSGLAEVTLEMSFEVGVGMSQRKKEDSREWKQQVKIHELVQEQDTAGIRNEGRREGKDPYEEWGKLNERSLFLITLRKTYTPILLALGPCTSLPFGVGRVHSHVTCFDQ